MRLELDPIPAEENEDLGTELRDVLVAVREVAEDRERIAATVPRVAAELAERPGSPDDERPDVARLLEWLADGRFVFLGYGATRSTGPPAAPVPCSAGVRPGRAAPGRRSRRRLPGPGAGGDAQPPVVLTRADAPSRVLRPEHPHHLGMAIVDADGAIVGEHRFVGLFTAAALHENVLDTPVVERRVARGHPARGCPAGVLVRATDARRDLPAPARRAVLGHRGGPARDRGRRARPHPAAGGCGCSCAGSPTAGSSPAWSTSRTTGTPRGPGRRCRRCSCASWTGGASTTPRDSASRVRCWCTSPSRSTRHAPAPDRGPAAGAARGGHPDLGRLGARRRGPR